MIIKTVQDDIFNTKEKHIAFAVNIEGFNDAGFAGQVSRKFWNEISNCGTQELGTVMSKEFNGKTFHALVCHSLKDGWGDNQAKIIKQCFDKIPVTDKPIATIAIGEGIVGAMTGADFRKIACGMHDSHKKIVLYSEYTMQAVLDCYKEEKVK